VTLATASDPHSQAKYEVRFDWGRDGAATISPGAGVIVLIDAISFTTTVEIATSHGLEIVPFSGDGDIREVAATLGAEIAGPRGGSGVTLSPSSITAETVAAIAPATKVVMPSLNGSRVSASVASLGVPVIAASLRNRSAVAKWILDYQIRLGSRAMVAVVAAGELRADGSTRFAVEDFLVAGSVIDALAEVGIDFCSPEAAVACAAYTSLSRAVGHLLSASASGQELIAAGQAEDVALAAELDVSSTVPVLGEFGYRA
jgi:2-phosphosulfolactate phosphatase